jgi:NADPH-dependent curcumin reductase CurA
MNDVTPIRSDLSRFSRSTVVEGLEKAPDAINMLFTGGNTGKLIVKV